MLYEYTGYKLQTSNRCYQLYPAWLQLQIESLEDSMICNPCTI